MRAPRPFAALTLLAIVTLAAIAPAGAHVDVEPAEAVAGTTVLLTFSFHHGLDGTATTGLSVQLPEGASVVDAPEVEGWEIEVEGEDPVVVTWSGGSVPDGVEAEFPLQVALPTEPGPALFPTVQITEAGELAWISEEEGEDEDSNPAPRVVLAPDPAGPTTTEEATTTTTEDAAPATTTSLPGTTLQAGDRGEGGALTPWLVAGAVAALVIVVGGGLLLRRHGA